MTTFFFAGMRVDLDAVEVARAPSSETAWLNGTWKTVVALRDIEAVRAHTDDRAFRERPASAPAGAWVAIDDCIETSGAYVESRALPGPFTHVGWATIPRGCVVNVGRCAALFDRIGGGVQAQYVRGPAFVFDQATGRYWHSRAGRA